MNNLISSVDWSSLESVASPNVAGKSIGGVISLLVPYIFTIAGILMFLYLLYGGYQYMASGNDPKLTMQARMNITYAIAGFLVIFSSYWGVRIAAIILDLGPLKDMFGAGGVGGPINGP
jgi:hypothetical protein